MLSIYQEAIENMPEWVSGNNVHIRRAGFELHTDCNRRCSYCTHKERSSRHTLFQKDNKYIIDNFEKACALVLGGNLGIIKGACMSGGELSYIPYQDQNRIIDIALRYFPQWEVASNGYDFNSPILNVPNWFYVITDHSDFDTENILDIFKHMRKVSPHVVVKRIVHSKKDFLDCCKFMESYPDCHFVAGVDDTISREYQRGNPEPWLKFSSELKLDLNYLLEKSKGRYNPLCYITVSVPEMLYGHCCNFNIEWPLSEYPKHVFGRIEVCKSFCLIFMGDFLTHYIRALVQIRKRDSIKESFEEMFS